MHYRGEITCCQGQQLKQIEFLEDLRKLSHRQQEIEFLLLGATTGSNIADKLKIEENTQIVPKADRK